MSDSIFQYSHGEDVQDVLDKIEISFNIKFGDGELEHLTDFGELCDLVSNKIEAAYSLDCTSQQAFYKLRKAISETVKIDSKLITPYTLLSEILPKKNRRMLVAQIEGQLGVKLKILSPPGWVVLSLVIVLLVSIVWIFFNWKMGAAGILFFFIAIYISSITGKTLPVKTMRELSAEMTRENYFSSRRDKTTVNRSELEGILIDLFSTDLMMDKSQFNRDVKLA